jgi:mono/diheme cytochrome c family protein
MSLPKIKIFAITLFAVPMLFAVGMRGEVQTGATRVAPDDLEAVYKTKCAMCHGPKAAKAFDPELGDEALVQAILEGKKAEKPPHMPAFKEKGIDAEKAQGLVTYMRQLRTPPAE